MHNHVFFHLNDKQVSKFCALWKEINNWLDEFLPFKPSQYFLDDDKQVSKFVPCGKKSTTGLMNFCPLSPVNTFWMIKLKKSFTVSFQNIGNCRNLTFNARISLTRFA
jgi:hypothetical protein